MVHFEYKSEAMNYIVHEKKNKKVNLKI